MGLIKNWLKKRRKRKKWLKEKVDEVLDQSEEVRKQRIKSRENIVKKVADKINDSENKSINCPYIQKQDKEKQQSLVELARDPDAPRPEPFGWEKGTLRGILTIWVTMGFLIITMLMIFLLPLTIVNIMQMWKILAGVFVIVVSSYFYSRLKMGGKFPFS